MNPNSIQIEKIDQFDQEKSPIFLLETDKLVVRFAPVMKG